MDASRPSPSSGGTTRHCRASDDVHTSASDRARGEVLTGNRVPTATTPAAVAVSPLTYPERTPPIARWASQLRPSSEVQMVGRTHRIPPAQRAASAPPTTSSPSCTVTAWTAAGPLFEIRCHVVPSLLAHTVPGSSFSELIELANANTVPSFTTAPANPPPSPPTAATRDQRRPSLD